MKDYLNLWFKWVAITVVIATVLFASGYHIGFRKASFNCALSSLNSKSNFYTTSSTSIVVYVVGEVHSPGVYKIPSNSRLVDAIYAAGGLTASADKVAINMAMKLKDGMKVYIPPRFEYKRFSSGGHNSGEKVNVNMASAEELERIPGIGPVLARRIIDYRNVNGPFASYEDLLNVKGIDAKTLESIKPYIEVP